MWQRVLVICGVFGMVLYVGWQAYDHYFPPHNSLKLLFRAEVDGQPLKRNTYAYANPGGEGEFRIRDFRVYLSNFEIRGDGPAEVIKPDDSYHLARFDNASGTYVLEFEDLALRKVRSLSFAIGVDDEANRSIEFRGDLDPNSQMAWNWQVGYKFLLLEGNLRHGEATSALVYHVGFSENLRSLDFTLPEPSKLSQSKQIEFSVDIMKLLDSTSTVDISTLKSVKFDRKDARMLADNYRNMITLVRDGS